MEDATIVLQVFKKKNPRKPLVVQAKPMSSNRRTSENHNRWRSWGYNNRRSQTKRGYNRR